MNVHRRALTIILGLGLSAMVISIQVPLVHAQTGACQFVTGLVTLGLVPPADLSAASVALCAGEAMDNMVPGGATILAPPVPPPLPAPGPGSLHLVTQQLTKAVTQTASGEVISLGSLTITETQDTTGYTLDVAFALASTPNVTVSTCSQASSGGQPWQVRYPPGVGRGAFDYPTSGSFLQLLADDGYIDTSAVDLSTIPNAARPTDLWNRQPTFSDVLGTGAPRSVANTLVPGDLFVNLTLAASQGAMQWEVQEWNYAFSIRAQLASLCPPPAPLGPLPSPTPQPNPSPTHGRPRNQCFSGAQPGSGGTCASQPVTQTEPTCIAGPRAGQSPPPGTGFSTWCSAAASPAPPAVPCTAPGACPAVLTCGAGIACPLLPTP